MTNLCYARTGPLDLVLIPGSHQRTGTADIRTEGGMQLPLPIVSFGVGSADGVSVQKALLFNVPAVLFQRNVHDNIYHVFHDDLLPLSNLIQSDPVLADAGQRLIVAVDAHPLGKYAALYGWYGEFTSLERLRKGVPEEVEYVCFERANLDLGIETQWFPAHLIPDMAVPGRKIKALVDAVKTRWGISPERPSERVIVLIVRESSRKIVNIVELVRGLTDSFPDYEIDLVSEDRHALEDIARRVARGRVLLGVHGALMIMGLFLQPGSLIYELFPYGTSAARLPYYRDMAGLSGLALRHLHWRNVRKDHPYTIVPPLTGGVFDQLPPSYVHGIKNHPDMPQSRFHENIFWAYRKILDTTVDVGAVIGALQQALQDKPAE